MVGASTHVNSSISPGDLVPDRRRPPTPGKLVACHFAEPPAESIVAEVTV
jgi:hypothetical protein